MRRWASASAPGKIILLGEHFVVSSYPALVTAIELRARVRMQQSAGRTVIKSGSSLAVWGERGEQLFPPEGVKNHLQPLFDMSQKLMDEKGVHGFFSAEIDSQIPGSAGLGSSAAVSTAFTKALSTIFETDLSDEEVIKYSMMAEKVYHGTPSGIDSHIAALGGTILYSGPGKYSRIDVKDSGSYVVVHTGVRRKTSTMVAHVQEFVRNNPDVFKEVGAIYGLVLDRGLKALKQNDVQTLGKCMSLNHILLRVLGVSSEVVEKAVNYLMGIGMYGAKLTGAGGGGCVIAVGPVNNLEKLRPLSEMFQTVFTTRISCQGVIEES